MQVIFIVVILKNQSQRRIDTSSAAINVAVEVAADAVTVDCLLSQV